MERLGQGVSNHNGAIGTEVPSAGPDKPGERTADGGINRIGTHQVQVDFNGAVGDEPAPAHAAMHSRPNSVLQRFVPYLGLIVVIVKHSVIGQPSQIEGCVPFHQRGQCRGELGNGDLVPGLLVATGRESEQNGQQHD